MSVSGSSNGSQLLHRITKSKSLDSGADWVYGEDGKLEYEYRLVCGSSYYGRDCDIICKPRHDNFGHYTCGPQGEKVCLAGWEKDNQNSARDDYCLKRKCLLSPRNRPVITVIVLPHFSSWGWQATESSDDKARSP